jgi:CMP-N,N'-diacetyllegionaminic acid synthase
LIKDLTFVIAVRKGSNRIKNKNIRKFGDSSLLEIKLKQIKRLFGTKNIFLSSDCKQSLKIGRKYNAQLDYRPKKFANSKVQMKKVYSYLASNIDTKYVCYLHVTSPFLKDKTLKKAINLFFKKTRKKNITLVTVSKVKEYLWYKNKALNYNPNNHPPSQTLPEYLALNFAINIVNRDYMYSQGKIVSDKFLPVILEFPENIDIDEKWQFQFAKKIFRDYKF